MLCGGYSTFHAIKPEEKELFEETVTLAGAEYEPFACAIQVVAGTNYKYLCNANMVTNPPYNFLGEVIIHRPLKGEAVIINIREIN